MEHVDLTQLLSSSDELDASDDDDDDSGIEVIDADIFKRAVSEKCVPKLFKEPSKFRGTARSSSRATTPLALTVSSDDDSDSDSEYEREGSPSLRYPRGRSNTTARTKVFFERSRSPSPEERPQEQRRNLRASTAPPPTVCQRSASTSREEGVLKSKKLLTSTKSRTDEPSHGNFKSRSKVERTDSKQSPGHSNGTLFLQSVKTEPPHRRTRVNIAKDVQRTTDRQRASSLPPAHDIPLVSSFTPTNRCAVAARKTPQKSVSVKSSPRIPDPRPSEKAKVRTTITPKNEYISDDDRPGLKSGTKLSRHNDSSDNAERKATTEARPLPPSQPYRFSRAMRPTIDRLKEGMRSGRVSVSPVKEELRITDVGRRAISAEMERRGITSSASYNEFRADLMREYSRLLFRSPVPHLSMMTYSMNELQDECLEIEARRPALERTPKKSIKQEQAGAVNLKDIFPDADDSDDGSSEDSYDSSGGSCDDSPSKKYDIPGSVFRAVKRECLKPTMIKKEPSDRINIAGLDMGSSLVSPDARHPRLRNHSLRSELRNSPKSLPEKPSGPSDPSRAISMVSRGTQTLSSDFTPCHTKRSIEESHETPDLSCKKQKICADDSVRSSKKRRKAKIATRKGRKSRTPSQRTPDSSRRPRVSKVNFRK